MPQPRPRTHPEINAYRRHTLIEGTIRSLATRGVAGTTVSTISQEAGTSRGLLGHYFATKDDVMVAALRHLFGAVTAQVQTRLKGGRDATDMVLAVPEAIFSSAVFTPVYRTAFLALWHETRFNEKIRKANRDLYRGYLRRMETLVQDAAEKRGKKIDARRVSQSFVALADGLWLGMSIHDDRLTNAQAVEMCQAFLRRELG